MGLISRVSSRTYRPTFYFTNFFKKFKMLVYRCPISQDELSSDSYPMTLKFNDTIMEVTAANMRADGGIDEALIGGNASAEGGDEGGADDNAVTGINVVMNGRLNPTQFGKKDFKVYMGAWFKRMAKWVEEQGSRTSCYFQERRYDRFQGNLCQLQ